MLLDLYYKANRERHDQRNFTTACKLQISLAQILDVFGVFLPVFFRLKGIKEFGQTKAPLYMGGGMMIKFF